MKIDAEALIGQIHEQRAPIIIDVRSRREFDEGHVPGARHIPFWRMASKTRDLAAFKDDSIVLYCGHGPRAYLAGAALRRRGFSNISYLAGHMTRWKAMNLPLEAE